MLQTDASAAPIFLLRSTQSSFTILETRCGRCTAILRPCEEGERDGWRRACFRQLISELNAWKYIKALVSGLDSVATVLQRYAHILMIQISRGSFGV